MENKRRNNYEQEYPNISLYNGRWGGYSDNEILLLDRIDKIQAINKQYNLLDNAYISFSGGKDSNKGGNKNDTK